MKERIERFIEKYEIYPENILYILRNQNKTCIYMENGQIIDTYLSMKKILDKFESNRIIVINKGIAVSCSKIESVENGTYTMTDGRVFKGRVRTPGEHKRNSNLAKAMSAYSDVSKKENYNITSESIAERFSILDDLPLPFAVFEVISEKDGSMDIIFRYLNRQMAELAESTVEGVMGCSFYSVFKNGDKRWLDITAEVAYSEEPRSIRRFSPEIGRYVSVYYFSPLKGFSACALI